jgi:hypothetical protein
MTPFQAIKATFYMLLAKAREPIQDRELAPVSTGPRHHRSGPTRPDNDQAETTQTLRRRTDLPLQHDSIIERSWKAMVAWIAQPHGGMQP